METGAVAFHLAAVNDTCSLGASAALWSITVNTAAASAVVTVYNGTSTSDPVVATINAANQVALAYWGVRFPKGLFVKLTGGTADVTVVAG